MSKKNANEIFGEIATKLDLRKDGGEREIIKNIEKKIITSKIPM